MFKEDPNPDPFGGGQAFTELKQLEFVNKMKLFTFDMTDNVPHERLYHNR